jgi:hypothetical protein
MSDEGRPGRASRDLEASLKDYDPRNSVRPFLDLIRSLQATSTTALHPKFTHQVALFLNELIPVRHFDSQIRLLCAGLPSATRRPIISALDSFVASGPTPGDLRSIRRHIEFPQIVLDATWCPSPLYQLLVMIGNCCPPDCLVRAFDALELFSLSLASGDGVFPWLHELHADVAEQFEVAGLTNSPQAFAPARIFDSLKQHFSTAQLRWSLGDPAYVVLDQWGSTHPGGLIDACRRVKNDVKARLDRSASAPAPYVSEMQAVRFYALLRAVSRALAGDEGLGVRAEETIEALFGRSRFAKTEYSWPAIIKGALEQGERLHRIETDVIEKRMAALSPTSWDWRCLLQKKLDKKFVLRGLLFGGFTFELPAELRLCGQVVNGFLEKFKDTDGCYAKMVAVIDKATGVDLDTDAVLAVYYYCELAMMLRDANETNRAVIRTVGAMVFDSPPPLAAFEGLPLAHADVVLRAIVSHIRKGFGKDELTPAKLMAGPFAYRTRMEGRKIHLDGYLNVIH